MEKGIKERLGKIEEFIEEESIRKDRETFTKIGFLSGLVWGVMIGVIIMIIIELIK